MSSPLHWPDACQADEAVVHCGEAGLRGTLEVAGVGKTFSAAMVKVYWLDGQSRVYTLTSAQPKVQLFGSAEDQRGMGELRAGLHGAGRGAHPQRV